MASSYQGYARPTGFQELTATNAALVRQQEQDNRKIDALEKQKAELDKRADKSEKDLERKLTKQEEQRNRIITLLKTYLMTIEFKLLKPIKRLRNKAIELLQRRTAKKRKTLCNLVNHLQIA